MPDDNRFAGIGEKLEGGTDEGTTAETTPADEESPGGDSSSVGGETGPEESDSEESDPVESDPEESDPEESDPEESDPEGSNSGGTAGPAFEFEATTQTSIYPRAETAADTLDDVEFEVERVLRREHDVRDLAGRELHDALVRLAAERPAEVAELVVRAREDAE